MAILIGRQLPHRVAVTTRQPFAAHHVSKPEPSLGIRRSTRQVFGHPFDEPQRLPRAAAVAARDVELERVDDLVSEYAIGLGHRRRKRHHDAPARGFSDAADAVGQQA